MLRLYRFHQPVTDEQGVSPVEYIAVNVIALLLSGLIIAILIANRMQIGAAMAGVLERIVSSLSVI